MICEKCAGKVDANGKCPLCGYDNSNVAISENYKVKPKSFRSLRVTVFMSLVIALDSITAIILLFGIFSNSEFTSSAITLSVVTILFCILEVIVALFILRLRKWALITYIVLSVIGGIIQLLSLDVITIIFKALLLYFIFRNDWEYFD